METAKAPKKSVMEGAVASTPPGEPEVIFYVKKITVGEHELRKMERRGTKVLSDVLLHRDLPAIVMARYKVALYAAPMGLPSA